MRISDWSSYVCSSVLAGWLPGGGRPDRAWFHQPCRALASHAVGARVLVIDNYDSFVFNLVQYLGELGAEPVVVRNDEIDLAGVEALDPDAILISPGPGTPHDAATSCAPIRESAGRRPTLRVGQHG